MYIVYMAGRPPRQKPKMRPANNYGFDIAGGPPNMHIVVYIHRVYQ